MFTEMRDSLSRWWDISGTQADSKAGNFLFQQIFFCMCVCVCVCALSVHTTENVSDKKYRDSVRQILYLIDFFYRALF